VFYGFDEQTVTTLSSFCFFEFVTNIFEPILKQPSFFEEDLLIIGSSLNPKHDKQGQTKIVQSRETHSMI